MCLCSTSLYTGVHWQRDRIHKFTFDVQCTMPFAAYLYVYNRKLPSNYKNVANFFRFSTFSSIAMFCAHTRLYCFGWEIMDFKAVSIPTIMLKRRLLQRQRTTKYAKGKHAICIYAKFFVCWKLWIWLCSEAAAHSDAEYFFFCLCHQHNIWRVAFHLCFTL